MEKRLIIAFALWILILVAYQYFLAPKPIPPEQQSAAEFDTTTSPGDIATQHIPPQHVTPEHPSDAALTAPEEQLTALVSNGITLKVGQDSSEIREIHVHGVEGSPPFDIVSISNGKPGMLHVHPVDFAVGNWSNISAATPGKSTASDPASGIVLTRSIDTAAGDTYCFSVSIEVKNTSTDSRKIAYSLVGISGLQTPSDEVSYIEGTASWAEGMKRFALKKIKKEPDAVTRVNWIALKNKYHCVIVSPDSATHQTQSRFVPDAGDTDPAAVPAVVLDMPERTLAAGESTKDTFLVYAGPMQQETLAACGRKFEEVIHYGFWNPVCKPLLWLLRVLYKLTGNYGWAIVIMTLLLKVVTQPLTTKSLKSMKQMQALQPELEKLKKESKDNPQKMNTEMMKLYKKHKVNPFGGCLPMIVQMPIFIALFQVLGRAVELRGAPFMWWIKDLSAPDRLFTLPFNIPLIGDALNLLPILMLGSMILQQKVTPAGGQTSQQKMMMWFMPIFFGYICYGMPSGLVLYWLLSTVISAVHQYFVLKRSAVPHPS